MGALLDKVVAILNKAKDLMMRGVAFLGRLIPFINKEKES